MPAQSGVVSVIDGLCTYAVLPYYQVDQRRKLLIALQQACENYGTLLI